jgi:hypothetical protein
MLKTESIGLQKLNIQIIAPDADIRPVFKARLAMMIEDVRIAPLPTPDVSCEIHLGNAKALDLPNNTMSAVITSPPYLNRNNYVAQQKAELALLSLVTDGRAYRQLVRSTLKSHVEADFPPGDPISQFDEVNNILKSLRLTENNNPRIPHMVAGYFEDLAVVFRELHRVLQPDGQAAFVLGNSRWGGVVVPVDHLVCMIAEQNGFKPEKVMITRLKGNSPQQMRRYGRIPVRESVVVLRKQVEPQSNPTIAVLAKTPTYIATVDGT